MAEHGRLKDLVAQGLHNLMGCLVEKRERWLWHQLYIRCGICKELVPLDRARLITTGPQWRLIVDPNWQEIEVEQEDLERIEVSHRLEMTMEEWDLVLCQACERAKEKAQKGDKGPHG